MLREVAFDDVRLLSAGRQPDVSRRAAGKRKLRHQANVDARGRRRQANRAADNLERRCKIGSLKDAAAPHGAASPLRRHAGILNAGILAGVCDACAVHQVEVRVELGAPRRTTDRICNIDGHRIRRAVTNRRWHARAAVVRPVAVDVQAQREAHRRTERRRRGGASSAPALAGRRPAAERGGAGDNGADREQGREPAKPMSSHRQASRRGTYLEHRRNLPEL